MKEYALLKWRHIFSYGAGDWEYDEFRVSGYNCSIKNAVAHIKENIIEAQYDYSDYYRGAEVKVVRCPSLDWLNTQIEQKQHMIKKAEDDIKRYRSMMKREEKG
mgnify:CR=1 FL=1